MKNIAILFMIILSFSFEARADILIGLAGPMTGSIADKGEQLRHGVEKAVADINKKGGLLGQKINIYIGDDACDPKQANSVANDMVAHNVAFVMGHFCSGSSIPASDIYSEANILEISPGSTSPILTDRGLTNVYRVCGRDDVQGPTAAHFILSHYPNAKIAIIHDKSAYGKGLVEHFKTSINAKGVKEVLYDSIKAGDKDFSALVSRLKSVKADFLFFGGYETEAGLIVRQIHDQGLKTKLFGGDSLATSEFWSITGSSGEGTLFTFGPDPELLPGNEALVSEFRATHYEPEAYTLYGYAAIQIWTQAVQKAGSIEIAKVTPILQSQEFNTALGSLKFDKKGDLMNGGFIVYEWKEGKFKILETH
jgi:branched-chain amino acid transport system substrate-binding protein